MVLKTSYHEQYKATFFEVSISSLEKLYHLIAQEKSCENDNHSVFCI